MRRQAAALILSLLPTLSAASTVTLDYTDMWWNPDESGVGANVIQQGDTLFVTLFVYNGQREAAWFVAPEVTFQGDGVFTGALFQTTGTPFGQPPFDPASVTTLQVGQLTFTASAPSHAKLTYNVGGFVATKDVTRLSWRTDNLTGFFIGARQGVWSGCAALNGTRVDSAATIGVSELSGKVAIRDSGKGYTCNYSGTHTQTGHVSEIAGNGVCDDGVNSFFTASDIQISPILFAMRYRLEQIGTQCVFEGYLGGIREAQ
jgi:hypothetical protein